LERTKSIKVIIMELNFGRNRVEGSQSEKYGFTFLGARYNWSLLMQLVKSRIEVLRLRVVEARLESLLKITTSSAKNSILAGVLSCATLRV